MKKLQIAAALAAAACVSACSSEERTPTYEVSSVDQGAQFIEREQDNLQRLSNVLSNNSYEKPCQVTRENFGLTVDCNFTGKTAPSEEFMTKFGDAVKGRFSEPVNPVYSGASYRYDVCQSTVNGTQLKVNCMEFNNNF